MTPHTLSNSVFIVLVMIFAAIYAAITMTFAPISYLNFQIRVSEIVIAFIPFYGWPAVLGLTLGTFISNTISPLGVIDLLVGTMATFLGCIPIYLGRRRPWSVILGFFAYAVIVSALVALELTIILALPFEIMFIEVLVGEIIASGIGASIVYSILRKTQLPYTTEQPKKEG
ncbi:MAG: QueT transporter family protein [Candidatus Ranarchaeia archaeon]